MSRTIRRSKGSIRAEREIVRIYDEIGHHSTWVDIYVARNKEEQRELDSKYYRYHGDHFWKHAIEQAYRKDCDVRLRMKAKTEIIKYMKNPEYEPIIPDRLDDAWWYWS